MLLTYWSFRASILYIERDQKESISNIQQNNASIIDNRLEAYEQILVGGAGLFRASEDVTEQEWHNYISTYDVTNRYPGVQAIGHIRVVSPSDLPGLVAYMRNQGFADFTVKPNTPRDLYTAVLYTEPNRRSTGQGNDLFTDPERRRAMELARDSGKATLTAPVPALLDATAQPVFLMFAAEYQIGVPLDTAAQREAALRGYVFAGFRAHDFFNKLLPVNPQDSNSAFEVVQKNETGETSFYKTPNWQTLSDQKNTVKSSQDIEVYSQTWTVKHIFNSANLTTSQRRNTPLIIIIAGSLFSVLLAEVIFLILKTRARELAVQRDRAVDFAKDELLSLASHQLRTPATTVKQYLGMVLQGFAGDITNTQEGLLEKAYAGNERQLRIINEMLHVAKIDSGRITLAKQNVNINDLLKDIVSDMKPDVDKAGHKLKLELPKQPITLSVDDHMLRMAIENLLSNAIKYTLKKGQISVSLKRRASSVKIAISDNGIGIAGNDLPKLYQLFTRLNHKQTQSVSGTGVGLYLAKHLVELHGGSITAKSTIDKGSVFTITLYY